MIVTLIIDLNVSSDISELLFSISFILSMIFAGILLNVGPTYIRSRKFPKWSRGSITISNIPVERILAYCVNCRAKKVMKDPQQIIMKNGKPAVKGSCPDCGGNLFRIGVTL